MKIISNLVVKLTLSLVLLSGVCYLLYMKVYLQINTTESYEQFNDLITKYSQNQNYDSARELCNTIIKNPNTTAITKINSQYYLGKMDMLGQGISIPNCNSARELFNAVIANPNTPAATKANAKDYLKYIDR